MPQDVKWDRRFREETFRTHEELTRAAAGAGADLVVWSESATAFVYQREPEYQQRLADLVRESGTPLLFGSPAFETKAGKSSLRNRAYLLGPDGQVAGWQDKQQLVPFGEFVPFKRLLFFARPLVQAVGSFEPGERPEVLSVPGGRFGTLVCYEVIFPDLVRRFAAAGAEFLVNITNDAWYERSAASTPAVREPGLQGGGEPPADRALREHGDLRVRRYPRPDHLGIGVVRAGPVPRDAGALAPHDALHGVGRLAAAACVLIAIALLFVARFHPGRWTRNRFSKITLRLIHGVVLSR